MKRLVSPSVPYSVGNVTFNDILAWMSLSGAQNGASSQTMAYYLGKVPQVLRDDLEPVRTFFLTDEDHVAYKQYLWLSTAG